MTNVQVIFVGLTEEAAVKSYFSLRDKDTSIAIGVYTERSKKVWDTLKKKIGETGYGTKLEEYEADFNNISSVVLAIRKVNAKYSGMKMVVNVTGLSKEGLFGLLLFYALDQGSQQNTEVAMIQMNNKKLVFPPSVIFTLASELKKKRRLSMSILEALYENRAPMPLKKLAEKLDRKKPTVVESLRMLESRRLVSRRRHGREADIELNEFAYELMRLKKEMERANDAQHKASI